MNHLEVQENVGNKQRNPFLQVDVDEECEDVDADYDHARC
jgi:hypothetical protein